MATAAGTELTRPTHFTAFTAFPFELRHLIWGFALPDDEPEVLILERGHITARKGHGTEPMLVDTAFPALMHVCRESRAFVLDNPGRCGIQFRAAACPDAVVAGGTIDVPYRPFRPELDTMFWDCRMGEAARARMIIRERDSSWMLRLRHLAVASPCISLGSCDMMYWILASCPEVSSLSVVFADSSDDNAVRRTTFFAPEGRRCKLRAITPGRAQAMTVVVDIGDNHEDQRRVTMVDYMAELREKLDGYGSRVANAGDVFRDHVWDRELGAFVNLRCFPQTFVEWRHGEWVEERRLSPDWWVREHYREGLPDIEID